MMRSGTPSGSGKYTRFETGAERIVDIFDIIQQIRDTGFHLKDLVDDEPKSSRGPQKRNERQKRRKTHVYLP